MSDDCQQCEHDRGEHSAFGCLYCDCDRTIAELKMEGVREGSRRRDEGISLILDSESTEAGEWRDSAYGWMESRPMGARFTSTDLVDAVGMPPSSNAVGAVIRAKATDGTLTHTGVYIKSARPSCHAAIVAVWERA